jgi:hypothetical protein
MYGEKPGQAPVDVLARAAHDEARRSYARMNPLPPELEKRIPLEPFEDLEPYLKAHWFGIIDQVIAAWQAMPEHLAAYYKPRCDERNCDHCHRPYRGPGCYCSLGCAVADPE